MSVVHAPTIFDIAKVREKLARAQATGTRLGQVWSAIKRQTLAAPEKYPWWVPFVALITEDAGLHAHAKKQIFAYLDRMEIEPLGGGVQFHFWCYSFPHLRWAIWFDLLRRFGAWTEQENHEAATRFLLVQARDFHSGLLTKPYPECVDNQAASLCLSSLVVGTLLADTPHAAQLAQALRDEANTRAEAMIGGMPKSGYSGEGSTYQGLIVAFTVPFFVEFLERTRTGDWFNRPLRPEGTSAHDILRMTVRSWMPSGLLLPWDDYGYQFGAKSGVAFLAHRTGDPQYLDVLERSANWSFDAGAGWGFDDTIWALIYWPDHALHASNPDALKWHAWSHDQLGGALVSPTGDRYLMQMWDPPTDEPLRNDVNPNSLVLEADRVPLMVDGTQTSDCTAFNYPDTWKTRRGQSYGETKFTFGPGTGGAHSVILVDAWESLRPKSPYPAQKLAGFSADPAQPASHIAGDVTGLYASVYPDARRVQRRSSLVDNKFWLVEDRILFGKPHDFTSRWYFRPQVETLPQGVKLMTAEGVGMQMVPLLGEGKASVRRIDGWPNVLDVASDRVDYHAHGSDVRWLWLLWPESTRKEVATLDRWWEARPAAFDANPDEVFANPSTRGFDVPPSAPPWVLADAPVTDSWWYRTSVTAPADPWWIELPRCLRRGSRFWINGTEMDLSKIWPKADLMPTHIQAPVGIAPGTPVQLTLQTSFYVGHREAGAKRDEPYQIDAAPRLLAARTAPEWVEHATFENAQIQIRSTLGREWKTPYTLLD